MIKVGDTLPDVTLMEYSEVEGNGCSIGPNPVKVAEAAKGKTIAVFALPGAFTPKPDKAALNRYLKSMLDRMLPAQVYVPLRPREAMERISRIFKSAAFREAMKTHEIVYYAGHAFYGSLTVLDERQRGTR